MINKILILTFLLAVSAAAQMRVDESGIEMSVRDDRMLITVPVDNVSAGEKARLKVSLIGYGNQPIRESTAKVSKIDSRLFEAELPASTNEVENLIWQRVKYDLSAGNQKASGIVSVSQILSGIFKVEAISMHQVNAGMTLPVRLRATGALDNTPVADVAVRVDIFVYGDDPDDEESENRAYRVSATARTGVDGLAEVQFKLPAQFPVGTTRLTIRVRGEKDGLRASSRESLVIPAPTLSTFYMLDKPLYQPGQKVHFRVLFMNSSAGESGFVVAPQMKAKFRIRDENGLTLYRSETQTSRFGVASGEWSVPPDAKLGNYRIELEDNNYYYANSTSFKVSRYELPNFAVRLKADKPFYLESDETAEIRVNAQYLFGKPVVGGTVRLVVERRRYWDWYGQRMKVESEPLAEETKCDAAGECVFKISVKDLKAYAFRDFPGKFTDQTLLAYFTDPTSNRTEEGRVDVRISQEPIHVYLDQFKNVNPRVPFESFLSAYNADGTPCQCEFEIFGRLYGTPVENRRLLTRGKTDANGNAAVLFRTPEAMIDGTENLVLDFVAKNKEKRGTGEMAVSLNRSVRDVLIRTDKALYKPGDPIRVSIDAVGVEKTVFIDIRKGNSTVARRRAALVNGRAVVNFAYIPEFEGELTVAAMSGAADDRALLQRSDRRVVYPAPRALAVTAKTEYGEYRPGMDATMRFSVAGARRESQESVLGVAVIDRAVEERAAADNRGRARQILGDYARFAGDSLADFDAAKLTPEIQLTAFRQMRYALGARPEMSSSAGYRELYVPFGGFLEQQFRGLNEYLMKYSERTFQYPRDAQSLRFTLAAGKEFDFQTMFDPWGRSYRVRTRIEGQFEVLELVSDGADKRQDQPGQIFKDDFVAFSARFHWFRAKGTLIDLAVREYFEKTGKYVIDDASLREALAGRALDPAELRDPWGTPLKFRYRITGPRVIAEIVSAGPDRVFDQSSTLNDYDYYYNRSDIQVWDAGLDYFRPSHRRIGKALKESVERRKAFPASAEEFKKIMREADVDLDAYRDPFGQPLNVKFGTYDAYADRVSIDARSTGDGKTSGYVLTITPVTRKYAYISVVNAPAVNIRGRYIYSREVSRFTGIISEQARTDVTPRTIETQEMFTDGKGAILTVLSDSIGTPLYGVKLTVRHVGSGEQISQITDAAGIAAFRDLKPGTYKFWIEYRNAAKFEIPDVVVKSNDSTLVRLSQNFDADSEGGVFQTDGVSTADASVAEVRQINELPINARSVQSLLSLQPGVANEGYLAGGRRDQSEITVEADSVAPVAATDPNSTPRVREYFPESLLWLPEIVTDKDGKAEVKFRTGDNITTWNVYAVGSDEKGRVGLTRSAFRTFQPFFVDLDAPKFLTVGDEIHLPTQVRNYTAEKASVDLSMDKAEWFEFIGADRQKVDVNANATANGIFGFRPTRAVVEGRQRVTALAGANKDAIEKPVTVRPDGEEIITTETVIADGKTAARISFPANSLPETQKILVRLYPNMLGHVVEAVDGLLKRPYGCAEQTISSTYPNLMLLRIASKSDGVAVVPDEMRKQAKENLKRGYERLLGYQNGDGGFGYWGTRDGADIALTAYAVKFLLDAGTQIEIDKNVIERAANYLVAAQQPDGGYGVKYSWETEIDPRRRFMTTTYVARLLGRVKAANMSNASIDAALEKSLKLMKFRGGVIYEPYTLALYGLAAHDAGLKDEAARAASILRENALRESGRVYWNLETNTPFYGWGTPGRVETTAVVMQFLQQLNDPRDKPLIGSALMFLLQNKDRYGVWYSTQTTVNVLEALLASVSNTGVRQVRLRYQGRELAPVEIAPGRIEPVRIEVPAAIGDSELEIDTGESGSQVLAQIVRSHYVAWQDSVTANRNETESRTVQMSYDCDKKSAAVMETVTCQVSAERVGFKGYGMLLAEIGIPPGAQVSRESLETALNSDRGVSRYEILPDRIVFYMWARPGGTKMSFSFRPRYAINAQTPASVVYDYYNDEARATVRPLRFEVK